MIIDTHVHIGKILKFDMPKEMVLASMEKYKIDYSLVSTINSSEVDFNQILIPKELQRGQVEANQEVINFANNNKSKIGVLLWGKPNTEGVTKDFEQLIIDNRDIVYGIKIHPFHSKVSFDDKRVEEYIKLAEKYKLTMVSHTAGDECSKPQKVYNMALKYPNVKFVMVHMGLETDNKEAINLIAKLPNLYGDTTWVDPKNAIKMINLCGEDKLMFGTDNPIDGIDTYAHPTSCSVYLNEFKDMVSNEVYEKVMYKNAKKVFGI
jgi:predicted TIM-barrel fold metal-dependent hydrolase